MMKPLGGREDFFVVVGVFLVKCTLFFISERPSTMFMFVCLFSLHGDLTFGGDI